MENSAAAELFDRAQRGDAAALGELLETYREQLHRAAAQQLGSQIRVRTDASDIVQGTLLEAQRDFGQFRGASVAQLLAWLRTILENNVSNTVQQHVFTQKRSIDRERSLDDSRQFTSGSNGIPASNQATPSHRAILSEETLKLANAIAALPSSQREAVRLRYIEGHSLSEIAARIDKSVVAVAGLIKRGLKNLRGNFADEIREQSE